jgi:hypothetical protein
MTSASASFNSIALNDPSHKKKFAEEKLEKHTWFQAGIEKVEKQRKSVFRVSISYKLAMCKYIIDIP